MKQVKKVLLVDDDIVNNQLNLMIMKRRKDVEVVQVCYNGAEALQFIKENCLDEETEKFPDLILLDIKMPIMNGLEFLEEYQKIPAHVSNRIRIVVLTSSSNENDMREVKKYRVSGYLNKPLKLDEFNAILDVG